MPCRFEAGPFFARRRNKLKVLKDFHLKGQNLALTVLCVPHSFENAPSAGGLCGRRGARSTAAKGETLTCPAASKLVPSSPEEGTTQKFLKDFHLKGQNLALTVLYIPYSLENAPSAGGPCGGRAARSTAVRGGTLICPAFTRFAFRVWGLGCRVWGLGCRVQG